MISHYMEAYFKWVQTIKITNFFKTINVLKQTLLSFNGRADFGNKKSGMMKVSVFTVWLGELMKRSAETNETSLTSLFCNTQIKVSWEAPVSNDTSASCNHKETLILLLTNPSNYLKMRRNKGTVFHITQIKLNYNY